MSVTGRRFSARVAGVLPGCLLLVGAVLASAGCSLVGDIRRAPLPPRPEVSVEPSPSPTLGNWVVQRRVGVPQRREDVLPVTADHERRAVEFADATFGAALYARCAAGSCAARLFVTGNGGWFWREVAHPMPVAADQRLYVGTGGSLVVRAGPDAWFVSPDAGATFARWTADGPPPAFLGRDGPVQVSGDRLVRWTADGPVAVPQVPPLPGRMSAATGRAERLWAVALDRGTPSAAASADGGRSWTPTPLPGAADPAAGGPGSGPGVDGSGGLAAVRLQASAVDGDVWLIGQRGDGGFPALWRWTGTAWQWMPASGHPAGFTASAPLGRGLLAMTGPAGTGVAGERWTPTQWPSGGPIRLLADGTLHVTDTRDGSHWLGTGPGVDRHWAQLILHTS